MKILKNLSLFKLAIIFIINLYFQNIYLLLISSIILFIDDKNTLLIFLILYLFITNFNGYIIDPIPIGKVDSVYNSYCIVDKILYKDKIYTSNLEVGEYVITENSSINDTEKDLIYNIKYISECKKVIYSNTIENVIYKYINNIENNDLKNIYKKIIYNEYISDQSFDYYLGYGLSTYYLLIFLLRKNKYLSVIAMILIAICFGFNTKLLLFLIEFILSFFEIENQNKYSIKVIVISLININLFKNYSILITLIYSLLNLSNNINNIFIISCIQSFFFGEIQLLLSFLYRYMIMLRIILYILALVSLVFSFFQIPFLNITKCVSYIMKFLSFSIRGKINIFVLLLVISLFNIFKIKNKYIKTIVLILLLTLGISNPLRHVSFIDVGQGDAILISSVFTRSNIMIDTGSTYYYNKLKKELFNQGIYKIDYLIITHNDSDHNGNIENLKKDFEVKNIVTIGKDIDLDGINLKYLYIDEYDNDNDNSLVYTLDYNCLKYLFTGDISKQAEIKLVEKYDLNNIDVLKVSHHGSKTGTSRELLQETLPKYGIISTNGNYNHPSPETIEMLNKYLVSTLLTKSDGTITFYSLLNLNFIKNSLNDYLILLK